MAGYDVVDLLDTLVNASAELVDAAVAGLILSKGGLAHTRNVDMDEAFRAPRDYARGNGLLLRNVAEAVVNRSVVI